MTSPLPIQDGLLTPTGKDLLRTLTTGSLGPQLGEPGLRGITLGHRTGTLGNRGIAFPSELLDLLHHSRISSGSGRQSPLGRCEVRDPKQLLAQLQGLPNGARRLHLVALTSASHPPDFVVEETIRSLLTGEGVRSGYRNG